MPQATDCLDWWHCLLWPSDHWSAAPLELTGLINIGLWVSAPYRRSCNMGHSSSQKALYISIVPGGMENREMGQWRKLHWTLSTQLASTFGKVKNLTKVRFVLTGKPDQKWGQTWERLFYDQSAGKRTALGVPSRFKGHGASMPYLPFTSSIFPHEMVPLQNGRSPWRRATIWPSQAM